MIFSLLGFCIYFFIGIAIWVARPSSRIHTFVSNEKEHRCFLAVKVLCCAITILACTLPMGLCPIWNGTYKSHRDQYEKMAISMLHGHLFFEMDVDERLQAMDNPYDYEAREIEGLNEDYWDHSYYKGHLYMYFGVVPVLTLFIPYQCIFGHSLNTYHATQIYVALFILGIFFLFHLLARLFFRNMLLLEYLSLSVSLSIMSVVYMVATPAMYCTAQSAAVCFMLWSILFYIIAVYNSESEKQTIGWSLLGAFSGALAFGCRPTIAIANLLAIPLVVEFFRIHGFTLRKLLRLSVVLLPYLLIGAAIMWYNYIRFENPFEFGQSYQLTITDQTSYTDWTTRLIWDNIVKTFSFCLFSLPLSFNPIELGVFVSYPILWLLIISFPLYWKGKRERPHSLSFFVYASLGVVCIIVMSIALFSPIPIPRYRLDYMWLLAILVFIVFGRITNYVSKRNLFSCLFFICSLFSVVICVLQFFYPYGLNYSEFYESTVPQIVRQVFLPWNIFS